MLNDEFVTWSENQTGLDIFRDFANERYYQPHGDLNERDFIEETAYQCVLITQALSLIGPRLEVIEKALGLLECSDAPPKEGPKCCKSKKA